MPRKSLTKGGAFLCQEENQTKATKFSLSRFAYFLPKLSLTFWVHFIVEGIFVQHNGICKRESHLTNTIANIIFKKASVQVHRIFN